MKVLVALMLLSCAVVTRAADIVFMRGSPEKIEAQRGDLSARGIAEIPFSWRSRIVLQGDIAPGDDKKFLAALESARVASKIWDKDRTVWLDSGGGDVAVAMTIGRHVRAAQIETLVMDDAVCASACILILASGVTRMAQTNAQLGLHRPYFTNARAAIAEGYASYKSHYDDVLRLHQEYFAQMGIANELLEVMKATPSNEIQWVTQDFARRVHLLGEDAVHAEWQRAKRISNKGESCVQYEDKLFACYNRIGLNYPQCSKAIGSPPNNCSVFGGP